MNRRKENCMSSNAVYPVLIFGSQISCNACICPNSKSYRNRQDKILQGICNMLSTILYIDWISIDTIGGTAIDIKSGNTSLDSIGFFIVLPPL